MNTTVHIWGRRFLHLIWGHDYLWITVYLLGFRLHWCSRSFGEWDA